MSDRLRELQQQRALLQEHLAWLDGEIRAEQGSPTIRTIPSAPIVPVNTSVGVKPLSTGDSAAAERAAEEIIAQYKQEGQSLESSVKRGCFLYFFIALALLGLGVFLLYLFRTNR